MSKKALLLIIINIIVAGSLTFMTFYDGDVNLENLNPIILKILILIFTPYGFLLKALRLIDHDWCRIDSHMRILIGMMAFFLYSFLVSLVQVIFMLIMKFKKRVFM